jgi:hypothetical protein
MSDEVVAWKPDDTFHDLIDGEYKGVRRVKDVLRELGITLGDEIITSKDAEIAPLWEKLRRDTLPQGFAQTQLPIILGGGNRPVMSFMTVGSANAILPSHSHKDDCLFRMIISGSIIWNRMELLPGDWMYVPSNKQYSFAAGKLGCVILHLYNGSGLYPALARPD